MKAEVRRATAISPSYQAYRILHVTYTVLPLVAGMDKFLHFLVNWDIYLTSAVPLVLGVDSHSFMLAVGVGEVLAALLVAGAPNVGGWVVGAWLCAIVANLLSIGAYLDVAARDAGLAMGAFALARVAEEFGDA